MTISITNNKLKIINGFFYYIDKDGVYKKIYSCGDLKVKNVSSFN